MPDDDVREFVGQLQRLPASIRKTIRPALREAASPIVSDAKSSASWSSRIPAAIRVSTSLNARKPKVSIVVNAKRAPDARPYENLGLPGTFRHPVFGHRDRWVAQRARPFLFPAVFRHSDEVRSRLSEAVALAMTETFKD